MAVAPAELSGLACGACGAALPPTGVPATLVVRCPLCRKALDLAEVVARLAAEPTAPGAAAAVARVAAGALEVPEVEESTVPGSGVLVRRSGEQLELVVGAGIELPPGGSLALAALALLPIAEVVLLFRPGHSVGRAYLLARLLFALPLALVGVSRLIGKRTLRVDPDRIEVSYDPIPWFRRTIDLARVLKADLSEQVVERGRATRSLGWNVTLRLLDGIESIPLTLRLPRFEDGMAVQQELNAFLQRRREAAASGLPVPAPAESEEPR